MTRYLTLLFCLTLTGCYSDQRQQLASCELQSKRQTQASQSEEVQEKESSDFIELCMRAAGYEFEGFFCPAHFQMTTLLNRTGTETNLELGRKITTIENVQKIVVGCYEPMSWLGKQMLKMERALGIASDRSN